MCYTSHSFAPAKSARDELDYFRLLLLQDNQTPSDTLITLPLNLLERGKYLLLCFLL